MDFKFRRQYPCGIYFLDFYCVEAKLEVELDGGGHGFPDQRARDEERTRFLAGKGIKVLRFWNHQMRGELSAVRFEIWHELMVRTGRTDQIAGFLPKPTTPHHEPQNRAIDNQRVVNSGSWVQCANFSGSSHPDPFHEPSGINYCNDESQKMMQALGTISFTLTLPM